MNTSYLPHSIKASHASFAVLVMLVLGAFAELGESFISLRRDFFSLKAETKSLRESNEKMQAALLRLTPQAGGGGTPIGLWQQDLQRDTGTLTETFKVKDEVFFGVVYKDRVTPAVPVWFFGVKEAPQKGSEIAFRHNYLRLEGEQEVLAFSTFDPNPLP